MLAAERLLLPPDLRREPVDVPLELLDLELLEVPVERELPDLGFDWLVRRELPLERRPELVPPGLSSASPCSSSPPSSSLLMSFFATPAAAVVATPAATPAAIFFGSERPSSFWFSSSEATIHLLEDSVSVSPSMIGEKRALTRFPAHSLGKTKRGRRTPGGVSVMDVTVDSVAQRISGERPSALRSAVTAAIIGGAAAAMTYRLLRRTRSEAE